MPDLPESNKRPPLEPSGTPPALPLPACYAELHCKTNFSFLEGASHPDELVERAAQLNYAALAVTDRNSLAGVVRAHIAAKSLGLKLIIGAELTLQDAPRVVLWTTDRASYARLSRLITLGRRRAPKGEFQLSFDDLADYSAGLIAGVALDVHDPTAESFSKLADALGRYRDLFADRCYLLGELYCGPNDAERMANIAKLADAARVPLLAAGDVHYHQRHRLALQDVLTAIRLKCTVTEAGEYLFPNAERCLKTPEQMQARFAAYPGAVERTLEIAARSNFSLDELRYEYPEELAPEGETPLEYLTRLAWTGARKRYPSGIPDKVRSLLEYELKLIAELRYEAYFLTVFDLVRFARNRGILCQGRGSAANSVVCYCLGVTSVDPDQMDVLFERFISRERNEAPDIDIDFEHERREEVLQYLYEKYGRERAGMTAEVITYRPRSAVRDVGKALGLSLDRVDALAKSLEGYHASTSFPQRCQEAGIDPDSLVGQRLTGLVGELLGFPRHLGQHVGGMVMTRGPLCELVPIENAAMEDRTVIEWDKDDLDELGILKVDCLALGMLSAIHKCFDLIQQTTGQELSLATVPKEDPLVYDMICQADTMGVFQIESRAQMSMLPRLKPREFYDLVIEVAIVRPGPIQGNMVHPYLRRRAGDEPITFPNEEIREVLGKTMGIPLFQEQAMRLAVVAAGFTPGEADQLRRAMGAWRRPGIIEQFRQKLIQGMLDRGLSQEFAEQVFNQIRGFGEYGFPESHSVSFALLVYISAWIKCHHPAVFAAALINSQPMGFYAPAQLVRNVREHGVIVRPVDVNFSRWDCTLEDIVDSGEVSNHGGTEDTETGGGKEIPGGLDTHMCVQVAQRQEDQDMPCSNTTADPDLPVPAAPRHVTVSGPPDSLLSPPPRPPCLRGSNSSEQESTPYFHATADPDLHVPAAPGHIAVSGPPDSLLSPSPCPPCLRGSNHPELETGQATPMGPRLPHVPAQPALRLGMRMVSGLSEAHAKIIEAVRRDGPFGSLDDFTRRTGLTRPVLAKLSEANAFGSLAVDRRQALWDSLGQETKAGSLPLLSGAQDDDELPALLPPMPDDEQVLADYLSQGLSLRAHPMQFHRELLDHLGIVSAVKLTKVPNGRFVRTAGVVLVRQRPGTAKGITFVTLEDETGSINLIIKQDVWQKFYRAARTASALIAHGRIQSKDGVTHVLVSRLMDLSEELGLQSQSRDFH